MSFLGVDNAELNSRYLHKNTYIFKMPHCKENDVAFGFEKGFDLKL
jgi:hypothetical protein